MAAIVLIMLGKENWGPDALNDANYILEYLVWVWSQWLDYLTDIIDLILFSYFCAQKNVRLVINTC